MRFDSAQRPSIIELFEQFDLELIFRQTPNFF